MSKGVIYITTTSVTGLIKIGKTRTDQFENRMSILEQNGYWNVGGLHRYYATEVDDYDEKERLMHTVFSKSQVANSELFALDKDLAKQMLESFEGRQIYPKIEIEEPDNDQPKIPKASRLTFEMLGIPVGSTLVYAKDKTVTCVTMDLTNKVKYNGSEYSISGLAKKFTKMSAVQGGMYFLYNNELLTDMRKRLGL